MPSFTLSARLLPATSSARASGVLSALLTEKLLVQFWAHKEDESMPLDQAYLDETELNQHQLMDYLVKDIAGASKGQPIWS